MKSIYKYLLLLLFVFSFKPVFCQTSYYVKENAIGSGTSWNDPISINNLATIINRNTTSNLSIKIYLFKGNLLLNQSINFSNYNSIEIGGSYDRIFDPETGNYIDIQNPTESNSIINGNNTTNLLIFNNNRNIDFNGFALENGKNDDDLIRGSAISIKNLNGEAKINNLIIKNNNSSKSSTFYIESASKIKLESVSFKNNSSLSSTLYLDRITEGLITNSNFESNTTTLEGGALYVKESRIEIENTSPTIETINFLSNKSSRNGGAIYNENSNLKLTGLTFKDNKSDHNGGAYYSNATSSNYINRANFDNNKAEIGGAIYNESNNDFKIISSLFAYNTASINGGAIYNNHNISITNATFVKNEKSAFIHANNTTNTIFNSIFYLNTSIDNKYKADIASEIINSNSFTNNVKNNILQEYISPDNLLNEDPLFENNIDNFRIKFLSPAFNSGKENLFTQIAGGATSEFHDLDKRNRIYGNTIDLGAYELTFDRELFFPDCPIIITPQDNELDVSLTPIISWNKVNNANQYKLTVKNSTTTLIDTNVLDNSTAPENIVTYDNITQDLSPNTWYNVTIFPENTLIGIIKDSCPAFKFKTLNLPTAPDCVTIIAPYNNEINVSLTPEIKWNKIEDATDYQITIGTTINGNDILNMYNVGNVDHFRLNSTLNPNTQYFVTIVAINNVGSAQNCTTSTFFTLVPPDPCDKIKLSLTINKKDVTVNVQNGTSPFQYSLDDEAWQNTNTFFEVTKGKHTIKVKTADNCLKQIDFELPNFYNFITPNNDNKNDFIDFSYLKSKQNVKLLIFNRFGKMIYQNSGEADFIWNGKLNGMPLPSDSYWYFIEWQEINSTEMNKLQGYILLKSK